MASAWAGLTSVTSADCPAATVTSCCGAGLMPVGDPGLDEGVGAGRQVRDVEAAIVALIADVGQRGGVALEGEAGATERLSLFVLDEQHQRARTGADGKVDLATSRRRRRRPIETRAPSAPCGRLESADGVRAGWQVARSVT